MCNGKGPQLSKLFEASSSLDVDAVELVEAAPGPTGCQALEELAHLEAMPLATETRGLHGSGHH